MADELQDLANELDDIAFKQLYGPSASVTPRDAAELLDGFAKPWWTVGGWAIEAFAGNERDHADLDVSVLACDVPELVAHFLGTHHVWAAGAGMLCPVLSADQRLPRWAHQFWVRESATEPWLLDIIIAPDREGRWVFRRDLDVVRELSAVTWQADDGLTYQSPEVTLAFKAAHTRPKDEVDLNAAVPLLSSSALAWLTDTITTLHPGHPWLERLGPGPDGTPP